MIDRKQLIILVANGVKKRIIAEKLGVGRTTLWRYMKNNPITEEEKKSVGDFQPTSNISHLHQKNRLTSNKETDNDVLSEQDIQNFLNKED